MLLSPPPKLQFFDANGNPLSGGKLYTYEAGTTTPQVTYQDQEGTITNTNPIILNSRGEANVWLDTEALSKFLLTTSEDVEIYSVDNIGALMINGLVETDLVVRGEIFAEGDITAYSGSVPFSGVPNSLPTYDALVARVVVLEATVADLLARVIVLETP